MVLVLVWASLMSQFSLFFFVLVLDFFGFGLGVSDESIFFAFFFSVLVLVLVWGSLMSQFSLSFFVLVYLVLLGKQFADQMHCERIFSRRDAL